MSNLYLVGTVHWDLEGPERLKRFLENKKPSFIGLEASEGLIATRLVERRMNLMFKQAYGGILKVISSALDEEEPVKRNIVAEFQAIQGYEMWTAYEYKQNHPVEIVPFFEDDVFNRISGQAYQPISSSPGTFSDDFLDKIRELTIEQFQEIVTDAYVNPDHTKSMNTLKQVDDILEPGIRELVKMSEGKTMVVPAGNLHFFGSYENNLYDRLADLSPQRIRLIDFDGQ